MTIQDNYVPLKVLGNSVTTQFSGNWQIIAQGNERVYLQDTVTGVQVLQILGTNYTLVFDESGFTVTMIVAPPNTKYVVVGRVVSEDQNVPYKTSEGFQGKVVENSFDKLTAITQDLQEQVDRSVSFPLGTTFTAVFEDVPQDGYGIVWDGASGALRNTDSSLAVLEGNAAIVAADIANINIVAADVTNINLVAGDLTNINIVATNITSVNSVAGSIANVNSVAGDLTAINNVAADLTNINLVAGSIANVNTVSGDIANINIVAGDHAVITTVAGDHTAINTVAGDHTAINTVAGDHAAIVAVAADLTNINNVAADLANINIAATNIAAINAAPAAAVAAAASVSSVAFQWAFSTTTTMADPGTGGFRANNASMASATQLAFSALIANTGNANVRALLNTWDDSTHTPRGIIRIAKDGANFVEFGVSNTLTDNTTWLQIPVSYIGGSGSFSNADTLYISFIPAGNDGTGTGNVSTSGTITTGALARWASGTTVQSDNLSGDVTTTNTLVTAIKANVALSGSPTTTTQAQADNSTKIATTAYVDAAVSAGGVPIGGTLEWNGTTAPTNYFAEDGSAISRTTYSVLFGKIGTQFGAGDGSTTFNIPDRRRRTGISAGGTVVGSVSNTVGSTGGLEIVTLTSAQIPAHNHQVLQSSNGTSGSNSTGIVGSGTNTGRFTDNNTGGGGSHENFQPTIVKLYCIRYQ